MWKPLSLLWVLFVAVSRALLRSGHAWRTIHGFFLPCLRGFNWYFRENFHTISLTTLSNTIIQTIVHDGFRFKRQWRIRKMQNSTRGSNEENEFTKKTSEENDQLQLSNEWTSLVPRDYFSDWLVPETFHIRFSWHHHQVPSALWCHQAAKSWIRFPSLGWC